MGLENLQSVFNDLSKNTKDDFGGPHGQGVHGGLTNEFPSTPHYEHSEFGNISENLLSQIQNPDSQVGGEITFGNPTTTNYSLGTGIYSGLETYDSDNINKRKFDISTLGKDQDLGFGDYTLETLYNTNHTANSFRTRIDTGVSDPNSSEGKNVFIDTGRAGMGSLGNLDIKGYSNRFRIGTAGKHLADPILKTLSFLGGAGQLSFDSRDGREPYVVNKIGSKTNSIGHNRDLLPLQATLEDTSRLIRFYTSTAGAGFLAKENIINFATSDLTDNPLGPTMAPPIPVPNTGFLNFIQQSVQGAGLGSIRRPFKIQYSTRALTLPFKNLGDQPNKEVQNALNKALATEILSDTPDWIKKPANEAKVRLVTQISELAQEPLIGRPTPFIDLSKGPKETDYIDRVSLQPVISTKSDDTVAPEEKGDFYVRIKDLRNNTYIYFRGFVTGITENVNPSWSPTNYIGRSEPVYMYERAERDLSFNLRVYPANHTEFTLMYDKIEKLTSLAYPEYLEQDSMTRMKPPFTELYMAHIGSRKRGKFGFVKSITYSVNESGDWDALSALPRLFDIAITYQILNRKPPSMADKFYRTTV